MDIIGTRLFRGPSLFADHPSVVVTVRMPVDEQAALEGVSAQLAESLERSLKPYIEGKFPFSTEERGSRIVIAACGRVAQALIMAVEKTSPRLVVSASPGTDRVHFVLGITSAPYAERVFAASVAIVLSLYPPDMGRFIPRHLRLNDRQRLWDAVIKQGRAQAYSRTTREMIEYMEAEGIPWLPLEDYAGNTRNPIQIEYGRYQSVISSMTTFYSSQDGISISLSKRGSRQFLSDMAFPVTSQVVVTNLQQAVKAADAMGYPVVLKKDRGSSGENVYVNLKTSEQVGSAFRLLSEDPAHNRYRGDCIIVENFIPGNDYRITVVNGKVFNALRRIPAMVEGDGAHSVAELVEIENRDPLRGDKNDSSAGLVKLQLGAPELETLRGQGLTPDSIPVSGQPVFLRSNANWSTGGTLENVTDILHPDNGELAVRISELLGIGMLGVDVISPDISRSYLEGHLCIIEVNHRPGVLGYWDQHGRYIDQSKLLVDAMAPDARTRRFPIVVSLKAAGPLIDLVKLGDVLEEAGYQPGIVNDVGLFIGRRHIARKSAVNPEDPAFAVLRNPAATAAVIERRGSELRDYGVGAGGCDIALVPAVNGELEQSGSLAFDTGVRVGARLLARSARCRALILVTPDVDLSCLGDIPASRLCLLSIGALDERFMAIIDKGGHGASIQALADGSLEISLQCRGTRDKTLFMAAGAVGTSDLATILHSVALLIHLGVDPDHAVTLTERAFLRN